jgi:hypothetical protein
MAISTGTLITQLPTGTVIFGNDLFVITHGITGSAVPAQTQRIQAVALLGYLNSFYQPSGSVSPSSGGDMVLITGSYLGGSAASVNMPDIPTGSSYTALKLFISVRTDRADTSDKLLLRINNVTTSGSYSGYISAHNHSGVETSEEFLANTVTRLPVGYATAANAPASMFAEYEVTIPDFANTNKNKSFQIRGGGRFNTTTGNLQLFDGLGEFLSTAAITRLEFFPNIGTNFVQHCTFRLYAIKG